MSGLPCRILLLAGLGLLTIPVTGCTQYAFWRIDRANQKAQNSYSRAVWAKLKDRIPTGMWYYELPCATKVGSPTGLWLSLHGDGAFDQIRHE